MEEESWEDLTPDKDSKEYVDEVSEGAEYSPKSDFSKAQIIYSQMEKCCSLRSEEMRPGYTTHIMDKMQNVKEVHIPDSRKKFISAVNALKSLLTPEIETLRKPEDGEDSYFENFENSKEEIKKKYLHKEKTYSLKDGQNQLYYTGREYIPEVGDILVAGVKAVSRGIMGENRIEGFWDSKVNAYYNELLDLYDVLFEDINRLIHELNYFKQEMSF